VGLVTENRRVKVLAALLLAAVSVIGCNRGRSVEAARENRPPVVSPAEQDFMMKTTEADLTEIDMARLALQKSDNKDVRDYANMIQNDHASALEDLTDLMNDKRVSQPKTTRPDVKKDLNMMNGLSGPEFDREFINRMVADQQKAIEMCQDHAQIAQDSDVKKYAEDLLPELQLHLEKAQRLQSKLFSAPAH
jgi:putative membrane protein